MMAHTKESIQSLLDRNPAAVERALVVLFGRQTNDEKRDRDAKYWNSRGFDAFRAPACSKYALWVEAGLRNGKKLGQCIVSPVHQDRARKYVRRYWRQLIEVAEKKARSNTSEVLASEEARMLAEERAAIQSL